ncbi:membrane protein [Streptomyces hygroscopicus subsp. hygroscopicus]|uniref:MASE1 domain-containing protein n=1 Tax=Streptomyces sp. KHY 26 TaxID=3097359 RepID=UPI0024A1E481|nr:MASE1 domain-containing protein [Streptomyces hygroscopicus]GLX53025.1 membrane protein [Streptomyces hygroscopicus subsp. hygroscopicus]
MAAVVGIAELRRPGGYVVQVLAVAALYYGSGRLGLLRELSVENAVFTPIYPPTGVSVAALLILGIGCWPGITLGALGVIVSISPPGPDLVGILFGNTAAPVCAAILLHWSRFRMDLSRFRDGVALVFLGALAAMTISATIGVGMLVLMDKLAAHAFWTVWLAWWVGDAMGVLLVTPLLLLLRGIHRPLSLRRWREATALTVIACVLVPVAAYSSISLLFLVYPLIIWAALRFELAGAVLCALFTSVMATIAATDGSGSFQGLSPIETMAKLQAFNGTMALTALLMSALITEQRNTRRSVEQACQELMEVLEHLTTGDAPVPRPQADADDKGGGDDTGGRSGPTR